MINRQFFEEMNKKADSFHRHLDECQQCREHPFALCQAGERLLLSMQEQTTQTPLEKR